MNSQRASQFVAGRQREQPLLAASTFLLGGVDRFVIVVVMWGQRADWYDRTCRNGRIVMNAERGRLAAGLLDSIGLYRLNQSVPETVPQFTGRNL